MNEGILSQLKADWDLIPNDTQSQPWLAKIQTVLKADKIELANVYVGKISNPIIKAGVENYLMQFDELKINEQKPAVKEQITPAADTILGRLDQIEQEISELKSDTNNTIAVVKQETQSLTSEQNDLVETMGTEIQEQKKDILDKQDKIEEQRQEIELLKVQKADLEKTIIAPDLENKLAEYENQINDLKSQLEIKGYEAEDKITQWKQNPAGLDVSTIANALRVNMGDREKITFTGLEAFGNINTNELGILLRLDANLRAADYMVSGWGPDLRDIQNMDSQFRSVLGDCIQEIGQTSNAVHMLIAEYLDHFRHEKNIV